MGSEIARKPDEGPAYWFLGGLYEVRVSGDESDDAITVMRISMPAGSGAPPHTHPGGEVVHVLEGDVRCHIEDEAVEVGSGASFHFPPGTREWFEAVTDASILAIYTPGGIDRFFAEVGEQALTRTLPPPSDEAPDFEQIVEVAARYGMDIEAPA